MSHATVTAARLHVCHAGLLDAAYHLSLEADGTAPGPRAETLHTLAARLRALAGELADVEKQLEWQQ